MKKFIALSVGILSAALFQPIQAQTLFTYGKHAVSKEEFLNIYKKNNTQKQLDFSAKSIQEYIELYALYKMKVQEAEEMRLDTLSSIKTELENYKNQLAKSYLIDKQFSAQLLKDAYERLKTDIDVSHILIAVRPNTDSVKAQHTIDSIYSEIKNKKVTFEKMAELYSDDKSSSVNGGRLGFITALQVLYPMENAAYQTPVGDISKPFKTQFGYHILKVNKKRPARGEIQVAQIMIASPASKGEEGREAARKKAQMIKDKLNKKESFESLVVEYSDDKFTNQKKGIMDPFGVGRMTPNFEDAAYSLKKPGDISEPIETEFGFHILKLIQKIPLKPLDSIKNDLTRRIENDSRSKIAKDSYMEDVKRQMKFKEYPENLNDFLSAFAYDTMKTIDRSNYANFKKPLFEINKVSYNPQDFLDYVFRLTNGNLFGNKVKALTDLYPVYQTNVIEGIQQNELEANNKEYRDLITEYRNGILLFDLMDQKIWSKASADEEGLKEFYQKNLYKYHWKPGFEGTIFSSNSENEINTVKDYMDKDGLTGTEALDRLHEELEDKMVTGSQTGRYDFTQLPLFPQDYVAGKTTKIFRGENGNYNFIMPINVNYEPKQKSLEDARGFVVADYQDFLEKEWNQQLKRKYPLEINQKTLQSIIK